MSHRPTASPPHTGGDSYDTVLAHRREFLDSLIEDAIACDGTDQAQLTQIYADVDAFLLFLRGTDAALVGDTATAEMMARVIDPTSPDLATTPTFGIPQTGGH